MKKQKGSKHNKHVLWFEDISIQDVGLVGGKNASLGEMYQKLQKKGIAVPNGFAVTASAYWDFLEKNNLHKKIKEIVKQLDVHNVKQLHQIGKQIRTLVLQGKIPKNTEEEICKAYAQLAKQEKNKKLAVAIRSSATAEDLPDASFAGQQETFLNIQGEKDLLIAVKKCIASLFTDRAISYREGRGYDHMSVALSVTVQTMVRSDKGVSGVLFTLDTESGFTGVSLITASYGLGEYVVKGRIIPDQYYVFKKGIEKGKKAIISKKLGDKDVQLVYGRVKGTKQMPVSQKDRNRFALSDSDVITLAKWGNVIEAHYKTPQDIEWAKDGKTGKLYIVQARPETVKAQNTGSVIERYQLNKTGKILAEGIAVGQKIGAGKVRVIESPKNMREFKTGEVLVTRITDPDWEPIMRKASAIVTEQGGKTSHAAIVSRELGLPCIVGVKKARKLLKKGQKVTVSCANGDAGVIYGGILPFEVKRTVIKKIEKTKTSILMNVGDPEHAFGLSFLPHDGIGLARLEFIFSSFVRTHPLALVNYATLKDKKAKKQIKELTKGYTRKTQYGIDKLAEGIGRIAVASYPKPVVVRMSDFKTNEYAKLIGGKEFEPQEENPMLGWRGASRYYSKEYKKGFALECKAIKKVREEWGLTNVIVMIPFCRTPEEGQKVLETMKEFGLVKGESGLKVYVMCEIPSNVVLATDFAKLFDGFSIGSNDLTQLTLGLDRDTSTLTHIANVNNPSVKRLITDVIKVAKKHKKPIGICGQAPSDYPKFAEFLVKEGIDSISLNPDTVVQARQRIARVEKKLGRNSKKTSKAYMSLVVLVGCISAMLMGIGAGCIGGQEDGENSLDISNYVSPAMIREQVEKKVREEFSLEQEKDVFEKEEKRLPPFTIDYPDGWVVENLENEIRFSDPQSVEYIHVYTRDISPSLFEKKPKPLVVSGYIARMFERESDIDGVSHMFVQIFVPKKNPVFIEGVMQKTSNTSFTEIIDSVTFTKHNPKEEKQDQNELNLVKQPKDSTQEKEGL
ncbi:MAG: phosphoenolpyruvate synthase [Candidatus Magasanikbacteria bacterium]|nr:phosphoenolpyruvate synthase [Candidatus Magasanikbacteria bacterium]|tara:strand:- start:532 stop:3588 length:3057 start_codon:yes stop_codon:yes gene_type:complete